MLHREVVALQRERVMFGKADLIAEDVLDGRRMDRLIGAESESDRGMVRRSSLRCEPFWRATR
jgi:hypothetical protein